MNQYCHVIIIKSPSMVAFLRWHFTHEFLQNYNERVDNILLLLVIIIPPPSHPVNKSCNNESCAEFSQLYLPQKSSTQLVFKTGLCIWIREHLWRSLERVIAVFAADALRSFPSSTHTKWHTRSSSSFQPHSTLVIRPPPPPPPLPPTDYHPVTGHNNNKRVRCCRHRV